VQAEAEEKVGKTRLEMERLRQADADMKLKVTRKEQEMQKVRCCWSILLKSDAKMQITVTI